MVDLGVYVFKDLNTRRIKTANVFTNSYVEEVYDSEDVRTSTRRLRIILDAKYEKVDVNKVVETQCQHLIMTQRIVLFKKNQKIERLFDGTLGTWKKNHWDFN